MSKEVKRFYIMPGSVPVLLSGAPAYTPMTNHLTDVHTVPLVLASDYDALLAERDALAIRIYNSGYMAGHHDTVEGQFTDIHRSDMATYHAEEVSELIAALQGAQP